jgi:pyruvate/2-oxoglutarate dehydrogenase complex dihydrolipoamide acyltransferase (E2) component
MNSEPAPIIAPRENVNDETVKIVAWIVSEGDRVEVGQSLVQIETSKTVLEIEAPAAGFLRRAVREGEEVAIGGLIGHIDPVVIPHGPEATLGTPGANGVPNVVGSCAAAGSASEKPAASLAATDATGPPSPLGPARFSRKARELMERLGLEATAFAGRGLVRSKDIAPAATTEKGTATVAARTLSVAARSEPIAATGVPYRTEELSRSKRTEANYLRSGYHNTLTSAVTVSCPTRGLRILASEPRRSGTSLTAIIVFEAARLLRKHASFNAFHANGSAHYYKGVNVGFALDAGRGLKVPVIRDADRKGMAEIVAEMRELMVAYLEDRLPLDSLAGATFTVTDLSGEGVSAFHPLINQGQSAILGVCAEVFPPGSREGTYNLVLSFDHQLSEGRTAAQFLNALKERLAAYESVMRPEVDDDVEEPRCARCHTTFTELHNLDASSHFLVQTAGSDGSVKLICTICLLGG